MPHSSSLIHATVSADFLTSRPTSSSQYLSYFAQCAHSMHCPKLTLTNHLLGNRMYVNPLLFLYVILLMECVASLKAVKKHGIQYKMLIGMYGGSGEV